MARSSPPVGAADMKALASECGRRAALAARESKDDRSRRFAARRYRQLERIARKAAVYEEALLMYETGSITADAMSDMVAAGLRAIKAESNGKERENGEED